MRESTPDEVMPRTDGLFGAYEPASDVFDEAASAPGVERPHWKDLAGSLDRLGKIELAHRWENARRTIREHGVTYNVYGDPQGMDRPWELDMVPMLIPHAEWEAIQAGLAQRTRLFNAILADLYGRQRLLRDGLLPPALVFANPGFLRPCHGVNPLDEVYLHIHGVDLARSPNGKWWALADRTQAPSGAGYALENRIVLSKILPDEFRDCRVRRLAGFFRFLRDTLKNLAPRGTSNPNIVLLTPGPFNETYFEHAYLARYLGFTIVEGGDLTVRDRRVFIKTLDGLQAVDVILRRVDDTFCDPLELREDSFLGVAGLVEAARAGNVTIANALGSGIMESPAFLAFLPGLCQRLLGEELKLPSVATWWCGQGKEQRYVLENLDKIVIKPAFSLKSRPPVFGERLSAEQRAKLVEAINARPYDFVGQEQVALSMAPVWAKDKLEGRPVVLRAYVAAGRDSYEVMPGGLTRVSASAEGLVVSMQSGGGSKDTWALSDDPVSGITLLTSTGQPSAPAPARRELPSRVADNLFWLGRYSERLEQRLRLLRAIISRMLDESAGDGSVETEALGRMLVHLHLVSDRFLKRVRLTDFEKEVLLLIYSAHRLGSVRELLSRIRNVASIVRDRFSLDTWRILNQLQIDSRSRPGRLPMANALSLLNTLVADLAAFSGMEMENMTRGHGWRFLDFGRRLERGHHMVTLLGAAMAAEQEGSPLLLEALLEIADSGMTYRRRYFSQPELSSALEVLLFDATNPRSLAFQLEALASHVRSLPTTGEREDIPNEGNVVLGLLAELRDHNTAFSTETEAVARELLEPFLHRCASDLLSLSDLLTERYLHHTLPHKS